MNVLFLLSIAILYPKSETKSMPQDIESPSKSTTEKFNIVFLKRRHEKRSRDSSDSSDSDTDSSSDISDCDLETDSDSDLSSDDDLRRNDASVPIVLFNPNLTIVHNNKTVIQWHKLVTNDSDIVTSYKLKIRKIQKEKNVSLNGNVAPRNETIEIEVPGNMTEAVFSGMLKGVTYEITVQSNTAKGNGPISKTIRIKKM